MDETRLMAIITVAKCSLDFTVIPVLLGFGPASAY